MAAINNAYAGSRITTTNYTVDEDGTITSKESSNRLGGQPYGREINAQQFLTNAQ